MDQHLHIIQDIAKGDRLAFRQLYDAFSELVYNTALSYLQNTQDAEETTQDVFIKVFKNAGSFKGNSKVKTWIYRITINTALNKLKSRKRSATVDLYDQDFDKIDFVHPGILLENQEDAKYLFAVIHTLPENQKTAFILAYIEEVPRQEIADIMGNSLKATESLLQRAKKNLREKLEKLYPHRRKS